MLISIVTFRDVVRQNLAIRERQDPAIRVRQDPPNASFHRPKMGKRQDPAIRVRQDPAIRDATRSGHS